MMRSIILPEDTEIFQTHVVLFFLFTLSPEDNGNDRLPCHDEILL